MALDTHFAPFERGLCCVGCICDKMLMCDKTKPSVAAYMCVCVFVPVCVGGTKAGFHPGASPASAGRVATCSPVRLCSQCLSLFVLIVFFNYFVYFQHAKNQKKEIDIY